MSSFSDVFRSQVNSGYPFVIGCGDNGYTPSDIFKYYDPNTQENIPLRDYYNLIHVDSSKAHFNDRGAK